MIKYTNYLQLQHLKHAGYYCLTKGAMHAYNGSLGLSCCIGTSADVSIPLTCPLGCGDFTPKLQKFWALMCFHE